jgi:hypothetical protein
VYTWTDARWSLLQSYYRVESLDTIIPSLRASIVDIFVHDTLFRGSVIIVEESHLLRWWHVYELDGNVWRYRHSSSVLLCDGVVLFAGGIGNISGGDDGRCVSLKTKGCDKKSSNDAVGIGEKNVEVIDLTKED